MSECITDIAAALSSMTRLAILNASRSTKTFAEIAAEIGIAPSTLTHHVIVLRDAGLVRVEQTGAKKYLVRRYREVSLTLPGFSAD